MRTTLSKLWLKHELYSDGARVAWLVVRDPRAGSKRVYTVHRIALTGDKASQVIGRELRLPHAREVVKRDQESLE